MPWWSGWSVVRTADTRLRPVPIIPLSFTFFRFPHMSHDDKFLLLQAGVTRPRAEAGARPSPPPPPHLPCPRQHHPRPHARASATPAGRCTGRTGSCVWTACTVSTSVWGPYAICDRPFIFSWETLLTWSKIGQQGLFAVQMLATNKLFQSCLGPQLTNNSCNMNQPPFFIEHYNRIKRYRWRWRWGLGGIYK